MYPKSGLCGAQVGEKWIIDKNSILEKRHYGKTTKRNRFLKDWHIMTKVSKKNAILRNFGKSFSN